MKMLLFVMFFFCAAVSYSQTNVLGLGRTTKEIVYSLPDQNVKIDKDNDSKGLILSVDNSIALTMYYIPADVCVLQLVYPHTDNALKAFINVLDKTGIKVEEQKWLCKNTFYRMRYEAKLKQMFFEIYSAK